MGRAPYGVGPFFFFFSMIGDAQTGRGEHRQVIGHHQLQRPVLDEFPFAAPKFQDDGLLIGINDGAMNFTSQFAIHNFKLVGKSIIQTQLSLKALAKYEKPPEMRAVL